MAPALLMLGSALGPLAAQELHFVDFPSGYFPGSIDLPREFGGALARNSISEDIIYAMIGGFGDMDIARIDLRDGSVEIVADGPFSSIGGMAAFGRTFTLPGGELRITADLVLVDNGTSATLILATDANNDGDFDDAGEVRELIAPILADGAFGFSGAQARIAPAGDPSSIPSGSLLFQTADGAGNAELLVIEDPLGTPAFRPVGAAYFGGFDFNGGFDFDRRGRIIMGTLEGAGFTGLVFGLENLNANAAIDAGESNLLLSGEGGMSDLVIDGEDDVLFAGFDPSFFASVRTFRAPVDLLGSAVAASTFARTDGGFLSALMINSQKLPFEPGVDGGATLLLSGFTADFSAARNLLTLTPTLPLAARAWRGYR